MNHVRKIAAILLAAFTILNADAQSLQPAQLRCEYRDHPVGVDAPQPRLTWVSLSPERGESQTAYQILVASSSELLAKEQGDLWDSGQVQSDQSVQINYQGKPLVSSQQVFWKVKTWDQNNKPSSWSQPATWTMGILSVGDWHGKWITNSLPEVPASLLLRNEFVVKPHMKRAVVHVSGLGQYELFLNGTKVGVDLLSAGWTNYRKTILYDSFDITSLLKTGEANAAGIVLGNGFYNVIGGRYTKLKVSFGQQKAIAEILLEYADGSTETVVTDSRWKTNTGPITFSCIYGGEDYDARLEQKKWTKAGFNNPDWRPATETESPGGELKGLSAAAPPLRAFELLKPVKKVALTPQATVYDLGQNTSLIPKLKVQGSSGSTVKITPSELLRDNGDIDDTMCRGKNYWLYTLKGQNHETWFPQFYYRGARYLKVEVQPAPSETKVPTVDSIEGVVVHTSSETAGEFSCSNELFNRIHRLIHWAQASNLVSLITDCPTREKLGWLEQYHLNGPALRYEWNLGALYTKGLRDMHDSQVENGFLPNIAPEYDKFGGDGYVNPFRNSPEWGSALILSAWQQLEFEGDLELARNHYTSMQHYLTYLDSRAKDHILDFGLGDWYDIGPKPPGFAQLTPKALTATAIYFEDVRAMAQIATLLGKRDDSLRYQEQAKQIRAAFNSQFFNPETHQYATGSQCANAMPLTLNIVDENDREAVLGNLIQDVQSKGLTAGDVGYRYLLRALADGGRSDIIFSMNNQSDKPGYGMQLALGATSLTEAWDARRSSSQNHFMLGQIMEWFYHDLAGIQSDPAGPGFKKIIIQPAIVGDLSWVKASHNSPYGKITSSWKRKGNKLLLDVTIPSNTSATIHLPATHPESVLENGIAINKNNPNVKWVREGKDSTIYQVTSGTYQFSAEYSK